MNSRLQREGDENAEVHASEQCVERGARLARLAGHRAGPARRVWSGSPGCGGLWLFLQLYLPVSYTAWRSKNTDIALVFTWLTQALSTPFFLSFVLLFVSRWCHSVASFERDRKRTKQNTIQGWNQRVRYEIAVAFLRLRASCSLHWCKQSFGHCPFQVTRPWLQKASIQEASETIRAINKQAASLVAKSGPLFPKKWSVSPGKEMAYR